MSKYFTVIYPFWFVKKIYIFSYNIQRDRGTYYVYIILCVYEYIQVCTIFIFSCNLLYHDVFCRV